MGYIGRLLVLLAVLLMPFGMQSAAASASTDQHSMMSGTPMGHCPDQSNGHKKDSALTCSMVCASTLPAQELARDYTTLRDHQLVAPVRADTLRGIYLEIVTPPPKSA